MSAGVSSGEAPVVRGGEDGAGHESAPSEATVTNWDKASLTQRWAWMDICFSEGHDFYYIDGSMYRWDCARCNWSGHRTEPSLPLNPSRQHPRFQIIDTWQT